MQPTEFYERGDSAVVVLAELSDSLYAVLNYSMHHNVSAVGVMTATDLCCYERVPEEPWFWPDCVSVIGQFWHL